MPGGSSDKTNKHLRSPLPSEEIHLPGPHPARGIYGFALYIVSWCLLIVYLGWAITPVPVLHSLGITYIPSKLWALAIGFFFPFVAFNYVFIIFLINCYRFKGYGIFNNVEEVEHDFGQRSKASSISSLCTEGEGKKKQ